MHTPTPPRVSPPSITYLNARRKVAGLAPIAQPPSSAATVSPPPPVDVSEATTDEAAVFNTLELIRRSSHEAATPGGKTPDNVEEERVANIVRRISSELPPLPPPALMPAKSAKTLAVGEAQELLDAFEWSKVHTLLEPFAEASDVRARCAMSECCLHLCEEALARKDTPAAKHMALESLRHATSAVAIDASSAAAHVWLGQATGTKAKVLDGGYGQARVCGVMVEAWDTAVSLAPDDPLAYHLLGSFAFHVSALPWAAAAAMRQLAPGLRKFSADDALRYLETSEAKMAPAASPRPYALTNCSMIGRLLVIKGEKADAKAWLLKAVEMEEGGGRLDDVAREAAADARKALKKV